MSFASWREKAAPIIERVLKETQGKPEAEIVKALFDAYPFGPRQYHPYKIWLDEIKIQRGKKSRAWNRPYSDRKPDPNQGILF